MGSISRRLLDELSRLVFSSTEEDDQVVFGFPESPFEDEPSAEELLDEGYDPLHVHYITAQNFACAFSEAVAKFEEFDEFCDIAVDAEDKYVPDPEIMVPITSSFHGLWSLFDLRFGSDQETIGTCLVDLLTAMEANDVMIREMESLSESRMGVYENRGVDQAGRSLVLLRELVTGREIRCHNPTGYLGEFGELWFVRLGPPIHDTADYYCALTTPYILTGATKEDWTAYLNKSLLGTQNREQRLRHFLKYGERPTFWHNFIFQSFDREQYDAIFLRGLPDVLASMPNAGCLNPLGAIHPTIAGRKLLQMDLTCAQRTAIVSFLPDLAENMDLHVKKPRRVRLTRDQLHQAARHAKEALEQTKGAKRKPLEKIVALAEIDKIEGTGTQVYQLLIKLGDFEPIVWRRIQVQDCTLDKLHLCIQAAMGWEDDHLFEFAADQTSYMLRPDRVFSDPNGPEAADVTKISDIVPTGSVGFEFTYLYDYGDSWLHWIEVESVSKPNPNTKYPKCLAGEMACPPEDCGGLYGYRAILDALADPENPESEEMLKCYDGFDPEDFKPATATRHMRQWAQ